MHMPLIAGNWKMNLTIADSVELVMGLRELIKGVDAVEVVVAPPFTVIHHLSHLVADSPIRLAGQDVFYEKKGAYTGEVSIGMLKDVGCKYVIVGHSERREIFKESDETVNKKAVATLKDGLRPIICVGETSSEREEGRTTDKIRTQVKNALNGVNGGAIRDAVIAYEPIWAIGTGRTASPEQAEEVHNAIRELLYELYDADFVKDVRIIYGGSVTPANIDGLMAQPNIDGALVGGASLKAKDFARIIKFQPS